MRAKLPSIAIPILLSFSGQVAAQQATTAPPQRDAQAVTVIQSSLAALGGSSQAIPNSLLVTGTYTRYLADAPISYPLRIKVLGVDQFRWEVDTPDQGTVVSVVTGASGWRQYMQQSEAMTISEIPGNTFDSLPVLALTRWAASATDGLTMVGSEALNGKTVYHISVTPTLAGNTDPSREKIYESTNQREIYLDQQTLLPVRIRYYKHPTDWRAGVAVDVDYSDFQVVSGIAFPTTVTSSVAGQMICQYQFVSIVFNAPVAVSDFLESLS